MEKDTLLTQCYGWILEDVGFQSWRTKDDTRLLWIKGDAGKGKTMMTIGLIRELSSDDRSLNAISKILIKMKLASRPCLLAYFFCQSTRPELNNAASVLRGLIYMLVVQREDLLGHIQKRYTATGSKLFEGPNAIYALGEILSDILNDSTLPTTYLLVDGLDECISGLSGLLHIITDDSLAQRSGIKWLVTSRNLPIIERFLHVSSMSDKMILELNAGYISKAVTAFVESKVQQLAATKNYDPNTQEHVRKTLRDKAEDTFLWVWLVCKDLERVPLYRTEEVLLELPSGLDPLYGRMMDQIITQADSRRSKYCKSILRSITLAYRPLSLEELAITAGLPADQFTSAQRVRDLISYCGPFLTIRENIVSFIHLSAKDYLTSGKGRQEIFDDMPVKENVQIAHRLLDAMNSKLRRDMCNLRKPGARIHEVTGQVKESILPQITYACEYWIHHISACPQNSDNILSENGKAHCFLLKHLLNWLEAMSLLKKIPDAIAAIRKLQSVLTETKSTMLSQMVNDILRFTMRNGGVIQEAPLQVYYSALLFAPQRSIVRRQFNQEIPDWMRIGSGIDKDWGSLLQTLEGHTMSVISVAFSPQGDRLASASWDSTVRLWDTNTGRPLQTLKGHIGNVTSVAFSSQGDQLVSASGDKTIRLWDTNTGRLLQTLKGHTDWVMSVAFSPQGDRLASASHDKTVRLWDASTGRSLETFEGHMKRILSVALSPQGDRVASAIDYMTIQLWDVNTGRLLETLECYTGRVISMAFSSQGDQLVSALADKTIRLWDTNTGRLLQVLKGHTEWVTSVAFSPQGDRLASASQDKTVRLWDANMGQLLQTLKGHTGWVTSVAFSPQGDRLASASQDKTARLWDANMGQLLQTLKGHTGWVTSVAFSSQGDQLASASDDEIIELWDINKGQHLQTLECHTGFSGASSVFQETFVRGQWVLYKTEGILLLSSQYQVSCSAACGNVIVVGTMSGKLLVLSFPE